MTNSTVKTMQPCTCSSSYLVLMLLHTSQLKQSVLLNCEQAVSHSLTFDVPWGTSNTNKTSVMSLLILKRRLTEQSIKPFGVLWGFIALMPAWSKSLKSYNKSTSAVYLDGIVGDRFRTTVVVRQRCLLSLTLFNIFLGGIMTVSMEAEQLPTYILPMTLVAW